MRRLAFIVMAASVAVVSLAGCGSPGSSDQPSPFRLRTVAGYLVPWDSRSVVATGEGVLTEVSPAWYEPEASGRIIFASPQAEQSASAIETQATSLRLTIMPSIANYRGTRWDSALIHQLITDPQARPAHIMAVVNLVQSHQWAGIDLDYESLRGADRGAYSAFIRDLAAALHQAHKRLSVTVHAKTAEPGDWSGAQAEDWQALGDSADEIRVMAYDYATETSSPGPIAPATWVESVLRLAVAEIPHDKILLGVGTYGYDWISGHQGQDVQWADAEAIAQDHATEVMWDATSQSPWFTYTDTQGRVHTAWYENARSLKAKIDLASQYRVAGVFIWRLGGEDPAIWRELRLPA
jgi:spore germination protein YaaH